MGKRSYVPYRITDNTVIDMDVQTRSKVYTIHIPSIVYYRPGIDDLTVMGCVGIHRNQQTRPIALLNSEGVITSPSFTPYRGIITEEVLAHAMSITQDYLVLEDLELGQEVRVLPTDTLTTSTIVDGSWAYHDLIDMVLTDYVDNMFLDMLKVVRGEAPSSYNYSPEWNLTQVIKDYFVQREPYGLFPDSFEAERVPPQLRNAYSIAGSIIRVLHDTHSRIDRFYDVTPTHIPMYDIKYDRDTSVMTLYLWDVDYRIIEKQIEE